MMPFTDSRRGWPASWARWEESGTAVVDDELALNYVRLPQPVVAGYFHQPHGLDWRDNCPCAACFDDRAEKRRALERHARERAAALDAELARVAYSRRST